MKKGIIKELEKLGFELRARAAKPKALLEIKTKDGWKILPTKHEDTITFSRNGVTIETTYDDVYCDYFDFTDEEYCNWRYGISLKSKAFIDNYYKSIGLISKNIGGDIKSLLPDDSEKLKNQFDWEFYLGVVNDKYIVEQYLYDDWLSQMIFDRKPSIDDLTAVKFIDEFLYRIHSTLCTEYAVINDNEIHWTEIPCDIIKKIRTVIKC